MITMLRSYPSFKRSLLLASSLFVAASFGAADVHAQSGTGKAPSLIITSGPVPEALKSTVYSKPVQIREITAQEVLSVPAITPSQGLGSGTVVSGKVDELYGELGRVQNKIASLSGELNTLQRGNEERAADYYASVATINTQLQSGTTPGNPRLVGHLDNAEQHLETLGATISQLNGLASDVAGTASEASYLLEATRSAYSISGAIEEDHVELAKLEDSINSTIILIDRVLNTANDEISRTTAYLASERSNLRALALGVDNGDLYGKSLANRPFSSTGQFQLASTGGDAGFASAQPAQLSGSSSAPAPALGSPRLLAKVKFNRPDVDYEQPVFVAVNEALERYPNARFDLVAVNPTGGNAAEVAIETTRARRNAEKVLRTLTQMGLPLESIDISHDASASAASSEVHLYVK